MRRLPLVVAVGVAVLGFLFVSTGFTNPGSECDTGPETYYHEDVSWPPGAVRCQGHEASGAHYYWVAYPEHDWAAIALIAAAAGLLTAALMRGRQGSAWAGAAVATFSRSAAPR